jgi:hypothetical protein
MIRYAKEEVKPGLFLVEWKPLSSWKRQDLFPFPRRDMLKGVQSSVRPG